VLYAFKGGRDGLGPDANLLLGAGWLLGVSGGGGGGSCGNFNVAGCGTVFAVRKQEKTDTFVQATVPPGATTGYVTVVTPSGTLTSNVPFRVLQ
jgi:hypothetical protein